MQSIAQRCLVEEFLVTKEYCDKLIKHSKLPYLVLGF